MYATLSLKRLLSIIGYPLLIVFVLLAHFQGVPTDAKAAFKMAGSALSIWGLILLILTGSAARWSPWRVLWRVIPQLNKWLFPDLNGTWIGTTQSNWPVIEGMLHTIDGKRRDLGRDQLGTIPLKDDGIEITIRASFFKFVLEAKLSSTGGTSHSITETLRYDNRLERFELSYVYRQDTPAPLLTDDASHLGAAHLLLDLEAGSLKGNYWTMRSWRSGLNTAGLIDVIRR